MATPPIAEIIVPIVIIVKFLVHSVSCFMIAPFIRLVGVARYRFFVRMIYLVAVEGCEELVQQH